MAVVTTMISTVVVFIFVYRTITDAFPTFSESLVSFEPNLTYSAAIAHNNYMDNNKTFLSFNTKHLDYEDIHETMSRDLKINCNYIAIPIFNNKELTDKDHENIMAALNEALA